MKDRIKLAITFGVISILIGIFTSLYILQLKEIRNGNLTSLSNEIKESAKVETVDFMVNIDIDNISMLLGKKIKLVSKDEEKVILITGNNNQIKDLPIGKYEVILPSSKENIYSYIKENTLEVTEENKEVTYTYTLDNKTLAHDEIIDFKCDGETYASIYFDSKNIIIKKVGKALASSFLKIYDQNDNLIKEYDFMNEDLSDTFEDFIPYQKGYKIGIYHVGGKKDLAISSNLDVKSGVNVYEIGNYGLISSEDDDNYFGYASKIENYVQNTFASLSKDEYNNKEVKEKEKRLLYLSVQELDEVQKNSYLEKYSTLFKGSKPYISESEVSIDTILDFTKKVQGNDLEDGTFTLTNDNFKIINDLNTIKSGKNTIEYELTDSDGNTTRSFIIANIATSEKKDIPENIPNKNDIEFVYKGGAITVALADDTNMDIAYSTIINNGDAKEKEEIPQKEIKEEVAKKEQKETKETKMLDSKKDNTITISNESLGLYVFFIPAAMIVSVMISLIIKYFKK